MQADLIEQLARQARRLRVGQRLPDGPLTWDHLAAVRDDFDVMLAQPDITIERVAHAMGSGFSRGSLSRFRNMREPGDYAGDVDRIARAINQLLITAERRGSAPQIDGFIETEVAKRILVIVAKTIEVGSSISVIVGDAGRGKSMALQAAAAIHPGSILVRISRGTRSPASLAKHIAQLLGVRGCSQASLLRCETKIIEKLKGGRRCLLIDEAHQMRSDALEFLRDLVDLAGVSLILCGTWRVGEAIADSDIYSSQMSSRVLIRWDICEHLAAHGGDGGPPLHSVSEISAMFERDKVRFTPDGIDAIFKLSNAAGLGGLRLVSRIVMIAASVTDGAIDGPTIHRVLRTLHGKAYSDSHFDRPLEERAAVGVA